MKIATMNQYKTSYLHICFGSYMGGPYPEACLTSSYKAINPPYFAIKPDSDKILLLKSTLDGIELPFQVQYNRRYITK